MTFVKTVLSLQYNLTITKIKKMNNQSLSQKTKLVVFKEHTLGYIMPEMPNVVFVLRAYEKRGATNHESVAINKGDKVRLANEKDFEYYRVQLDGYRNDSDYEFEK